jgi:NAD(P)-dependent dehydrogenase (short-subunit alcohol dehydrogenase family)
MERLRKPDQVAAVVKFLRSEQASYYTETVNQIDGDLYETPA